MADWIKKAAEEIAEKCHAVPSMVAEVIARNVPQPQILVPQGSAPDAIRDVIAEKERLEIKTWIEQQRNDYQGMPKYGATDHDMFRVLKGRMEGYKHVLDYLYERDSIPAGMCRICFGKLEPHGQCSQCGEYQVAARDVPQSKPEPKEKV